MVPRQMETDNDLDITVQHDRDCFIGIENCFPIYERLLDLFLSPNQQTRNNLLDSISISNICFRQ